ncbi:MAG: autotransporter outer membrane beta-barrel domain-containing protein [Sutterellaceae bacterium]|nr:autotransporter outer membrane beta-barrel domain-containing protein [Sutterellaceae bacterium]
MCTQRNGGFAAGFKCPNNRGSVYVRGSVVHDFRGENDLGITNDAGNSRKLTTDFGGTWFEYGIGANFNVSESTYIYADFERTDGGEIEQPWRVNLGMRYAF